MCSEYEQRICYAEYSNVMQDLALGIPARQSELDLAPRAQIKIGDIGPVIRCVGDNTVELAEMKFGFPPVRKHGPVFNIRSQGKSFSDGHRCLVPASAFLETTGSKHSKGKYRFELVDAPFMAIAAIWRRGRKSQPSAFAMLTTYPGFDVEPFHNRQVVVLRPSDWKAWLDLERSPASLWHPRPRASLTVELARPSDLGMRMS